MQIIDFAIRDAEVHIGVARVTGGTIRLNGDFRFGIRIEYHNTGGSHLLDPRSIPAAKPSKMMKRMTR